VNKIRSFPKPGTVPAERYLLYLGKNGYFNQCMRCSDTVYRVSIKLLIVTLMPVR